MLVAENTVVNTIKQGPTIGKEVIFLGRYLPLPTKLEERPASLKLSNYINNHFIILLMSAREGNKGSSSQGYGFSSGNVWM